MSMLEFQKVLLSLYTNESLLHNFLEDRQKILKDYVLTNSEQKALESLPAEKLHTFLRQLQNKRTRIATEALGMFRQKGFSPVLFFPIFKTGPALLFLEGEKKIEVPISSSVALLFSQMEGEELSARAILRSFRASLIRAQEEIAWQEPRFVDMWRALYTIWRCNLTGRIMKKPL